MVWNYLDISAMFFALYLNDKCVKFEFGTKITKQNELRNQPGNREKLVFKRSHILCDPKANLKLHLDILVDC